MRDTPKNPQKAIEKAKALLATPLERIPSVEDIPIIERFDLGLLELFNTQKSFRKFANTEGDLGDFPIPTHPSYTVKHFLWGQLYAEFKMPVNTQQGLILLSTDPELESDIRKIAENKRKEANRHKPNTRKEGLFDRNYVDYVSFLQALDALAENKVPSEPQKQELRKGLQCLQQMRTRENEEYVKRAKKAENPALIKQIHATERATCLIRLLQNNPDCADVPTYITTDIRNDIRELNKTTDKPIRTRLAADVLVKLVRLVFQHTDLEEGEDRERAVKQITGESPKAQILTYIISELLEINRHLGISGKGGGRGGRGSSPQDS